MLSRDPARHLLRVLGVGFGIAAVIGGTVGVGILRTPGLVTAQLPSPVLVLALWLLGGGYALLEANGTAELATLLPEAGGPYVYVRAAFGDFPAFVVGWADWFSSTVSIAFFGVSIAEFAAGLAPALARAPGTVAAAVLTALVALQLLGVRAGGAVQRWTSAAKAVGFVAVVVALFWRGGPAPAGPAAALPGGWALVAAGVAGFRALVVTYGGWNSAVYFAEEVTDPTRSLPRALFGGLLGVVAIYVVVNAALLHVLTPAQISASVLPLADAAQTVFGGRSADAITLLVIASLVSILNASMMQVPRIVYGLARDGLLWHGMAQVGRSGTPVTATLATGAVAVLLALTGTFDALAALYATIGVFSAVLVNAAVFALRRRWPDRPRPYAARGYPASVAFILAVDVLLGVAFVVDDPASGLYALGALAGSIPLYRLARRTA
jgi:APA family basic amino acid/polyamine antiporter